MPGVKNWIAKASTDLMSSKKLIKDDDDTLDSAAYFTQQSAAEKALKAYLSSFDKLTGFAQGFAGHGRMTGPYAKAGLLFEALA